MKLTDRVVVSFILFFSTSVSGKRYTMDMVYYEMAPLIHRNGSGILKGIIPDIIQTILHACDIDLRFTVDAKTEENFTNLMKNHEMINRSLSGDWLWLPMLTKVSDRNLRDLDVYDFALFHSPGIEVLVHRDQIGILSKVWNGIYGCRYLFSIALILTGIFGVLIWFIELWKNPDYPKTLAGCGKGWYLRCFLAFFV